MSHFEDHSVLRRGSAVWKLREQNVWIFVSFVMPALQVWDVVVWPSRLRALRLPSKKNAAIFLVSFVVYLDPSSSL